VTLENVTPPKRGHGLLDFLQGGCRPELIQFVGAALRRIEFDVNLTAGNCYRVTVTALQLGARQPYASYRSIGTGQTQFKAGLGFGKKSCRLGCIL